jgi:site-specific recombinase XerD
MNDIELPKVLDGAQNETGSICVSGSRGRKSRNLPLDLKLCQTIGEYLKFRPNVETDILFINKFGFPLKNRGVQKLVKKYIDKAGVRYASVSSLRTPWVHLASVGVRSKTIQEIMGLKDIRTASSYNMLSKKGSGDFEHSYL